MMIKPGISALEKCVEDGCRYILVTMAAKRARMIGEGSECMVPCESEMVPCESENPVSQAIMEISTGKVGHKPVKLVPENAVTENFAVENFVTENFETEISEEADYETENYEN